MLQQKTLNLKLDKLLARGDREAGDREAPNEIELVQALADGCLYAILDACDEPQVLNMAKVLGSNSMSLYAGASAERFQDFAPYLAKVDLTLLAWIAKNLAGKPWGMFLVARASLVEVRKHLRKFLMVELSGRKVYFRFYDPRILPPFLSQTTEPDLREFFGPIERFIVPTDKLDQLLELSTLT